MVSVWLDAGPGGVPELKGQPVPLHGLAWLGHIQALDPPLKKIEECNCNCSYSKDFLNTFSRCIIILRLSRKYFSTEIFIVYCRLSPAGQPAPCGCGLTPRAAGCRRGCRGAGAGPRCWRGAAAGGSGATWTRCPSPPAWVTRWSAEILKAG